jgi:hypothetical protein
MGTTSIVTLAAARERKKESKKENEEESENVPIANLVPGFIELLSAWGDYKKTCEIETTRREQIWADRDVRITAIKEQATIFREALRETFRERAALFDKSFEMLDAGFASDNDRKINTALALSVKQVETNPMAQALQLIRDMNDPNVHEIEI